MKPNVTPEHAAQRVAHILAHWAGGHLEHLETLEPETVTLVERRNCAALEPHLRACRDAAHKAGRDQYDVRLGFDPDERGFGVYLNDRGTWYRVANEVPKP